ncbi:MAG: 30S ribosomal protein S17 [Planctomycetota bacterium]|nr:MAG: 30S ribosomal protein S17 [Planctomycetota bacterium]
MRRQLVGVVTRDQNSKTRRVEVPRLYRHPKYGKIVRARTVCHVHDEKDESRNGDTVEIVECRPRSRTKRWELVRVIQIGNRAPQVSETAGAAPQS